MDNLKHVQKDPLGLYIHIPFCQFLCHYCDFAKTARWDSQVIRSYLVTLEKHLEAWMVKYGTVSNNFNTLHLGGGTPGILSSELEPLFARLDHLGFKFEELTIESNPENLSREAIEIWRGLGINRLSVGVQSFSSQGLKFLTRLSKSKSELIAKLELARNTFSNLSIDLIYAWPAQSEAILAADLEQLEQLEIPHVSIYNLCYEPRTPIGRAWQRGKLQSPPDSHQEKLYRLCCSTLSQLNFTHYECSNWAKRGFESRHNLKYWRDHHFLGLGVGAWSYLPNLAGEADSAFGYRLAYTRSLKSFISEIDPLATKLITIDRLDRQKWLLDYLGTHLRCRHGISIAKLKRYGFNFSPSPFLRQAINSGRLISAQGNLSLSEAEFIRENTWCMKILEACQ